MSIPMKLVADLAKATVPEMRNVVAEMTASGVDVSPSFRTTATVTIDGVESRFRVTVELDPDETDDD